MPPRHSEKKFGIKLLTYAKKRYIIKISKDNTIPKNQRVFWFGNPNNCIKKVTKASLFFCKKSRKRLSYQFFEISLYNPEFCRDSITYEDFIRLVAELYNPEFCRDSITSSSLRSVGHMLYNPEFCRDSITQSHKLSIAALLYNPEFCRVVSFELS